MKLITAVLPGLRMESDNTIVTIPLRMMLLFVPEQPVVPKSSVMVFGNAPPETVTVAQVVVPIQTNGSLLPESPSVSTVSFKMLLASSVNVSLMACLLDKSKVFSIYSEIDSFLQEEKENAATNNETAKMIFFVCIMYNFVFY